MDEVIKFLQDNSIFFLSTIDGEQPRVRPFGAVMKWEDKLYFCSNNQKKVFKQILANPNIEISAASPQGEWIRLTGKAVPDPRKEARAAMLEAAPSLKNLYSIDDGIFEVFYIHDSVATFCALDGRPPRTIKLNSNLSE